MPSYRQHINSVETNKDKPVSNTSKYENHLQINHMQRNEILQNVESSRVNRSETSKLYHNFNIGRPTS